MATVPGDPNDPTGQAPVPPLPMLLMAGAIMHQQGKFQQMAGDVVPYGKGPAPETLEALGRAVHPARGYEGADPDAVAKAAMQGKVKVLTPTPEGK